MIHFVRLISCVSLLLLTQTLFATENIDPQSGLVMDTGFDTVKKQCTVCHSAQLITQNKASYQQWQKNHSLDAERTRHAKVKSEG